MMLPGASVYGLVFSHPEAQFPCEQTRSWCASATDLGEIAEVFHSCDVELIVVRQSHRSWEIAKFFNSRDVELIVVRQCHRSWVSRSGRCHRLSSSPDGGHPSCTETGGSLQGVHAVRG